MREQSTVPLILEFNFKLASLIKSILKHKNNDVSCSSWEFFSYRGHNTVKLMVTKGGPLPFAWDILSPQFQYGSKVYVKHPEDIPDYKKLSFPEGFKWERVMNFEDGGVVAVTQDSR